MLRSALFVALSLSTAALFSGCGDEKAKPDAGAFGNDAGGGERTLDSPVTDVPTEPQPDHAGRSFVDVYGIFGDKTGTFGCAGATCHLAVDDKPIMYGGDLHMDTVVSACSDLVNVGVNDPAGKGKKRVVPGSLADSWLWCKLTTTMCGTQEPRGTKHVPLEPFYTDVIKSWIENGAHCP